MKRRMLSAVSLLLVLCTLLSACQDRKTKKTEEETVDMFADSMQKSDPSKDDVFNILLVGSSAFYYQLEEMHGLAKAAGINMRVYHAYYSGCTLKQHYTWWKEGQSNYRLTCIDDNGKVVTENTGLEYAMQQQNWDAIGLCAGNAAVMRSMAPEEFVASRELYLTELLGLFRKEFPASKIYWQQHNAYQIGFTSEQFSIMTPDQQQADADTYRKMSQLIAEKYDLQWIPRGDAGQIARANPVVGDTLCARLGINGNLGDNAHEGDIGGGQYLTACTWFEILFGQSCIGNTYRPDYELSEEKIAALQQAAHQAVADSGQMK